MQKITIENPGIAQERQDTSMVDRDALEELYAKYNRREYVHPDPLEFLYDYPDPADREIVGLIASCLAYGGVRQILKSVGRVLERIPEPARILSSTSRAKLERTFKDFKHRFTTGEELASMLYGAARVIKRFGSIENCVLDGMSEDSDSILPGLCRLVDEICRESGSGFMHLLPHPNRKSACKRLNLFARWMVRGDEVDPGGWYNVPSSGLVVPIDIHMHRICRSLGMTGRSQADLRTAIQITETFRRFSPDDPVKYDFALTRLGIRKELDPKDFIERCTDCRVSSKSA